LDNRGNKKVIEKIDNLIEQNKIIARGLTLMHERMSGQTPQPPQRISPQGMMPSSPPKPKGMEEYQKSISSNAPPRAPMNIPKK